MTFDKLMAQTQQLIKFFILYSQQRPFESVALARPAINNRSQHQYSYQHLRRRNHGTSLKKICPPSLKVCLAFAAQDGGFGMVVA